MSEVKNAVTIMFQVSIVVKGVEKKLTEMGYGITELVGDFEQLEYLTKRDDLFVTYLPSDILDDQKKLKKLIQICDTVRSSGKRMIVIGEYKFHDDLIREVPSITNFEWMDRPVDLNAFAVLVEKESEDTGNRKKRILIVDDDPAYAKMVREWIKDLYRVDIVTAGMQAISFLLKVKEEEKVDLILLDYEMPVIDGPQVLQMLRQDPKTEHIPVVFLTGVGTKDAVERVMALKPDGYILKSTTRDAIILYLASKF